MKAAYMDARPSFPLMKQNDAVSFYRLQMSRWLFLHEKYKALSLESKVEYTRRRGAKHTPKAASAVCGLSLHLPVLDCGIDGKVFTQCGIQAVLENIFGSSSAMVLVARFRGWERITSIC